MKSIALISFVVLAVGLYWFMPGGETESTQALTLESAATGQDTGEPSELPPASGTPATEEGMPASERSEVEATAVVDNSVAIPLAPTPLTGQVILSEVSGAKLGKLDGTLEVMLWTEHNGADIEVVEVRQGQFELDVAGLTHITIEDIWMEGRGALLAPPYQEFPLDQGPLTVFVEWTNTVRLSVVDAKTSQHLSGIRIVSAAGGWSREPGQHPGRVTETSLTLSGRVSPLDMHASTLQARLGSAHYYAHSPGYAWQPFSIDFASGGEREVRLVPGGALSIRLIGDLPVGGAALRLLPQPSTTKEPAVSFGATTKQPVVMEDLKTGHYVVQVQEGSWFQDPIIHGEMEVDVIAGVRGEYELTLEGPPEFQMTKLAGTLVVPSAWSFENFTLGAEYDGTSPDGKGLYEVAQKDMERQAGEQDAWSFDFGPVVSGTYKLSFRGEEAKYDSLDARAHAILAGISRDFMHHALKLQVLPGQADNVRLEIPPPALVTVHVIDEQSGEGASIRSLSWGSLVPPAGYPLKRNSLSNNGTPGFYEFRAPVGEIQLGSFGGDFTSLSERVQVHAGTNEFTFRLKHNCPLTILFLDGESHVPLSGFWFPKPEHLDGEGKLLFTTRNEAGFASALSDSGRYRFSMPEFEGFEAVPDQTIRVVSGEMTTYKVQLVREK